MPRARHAVQNQVAEWSYSSGRSYADPFNEVDLDVVFTGCGGTWRVPAFWAGDNEWRVRFSPPEPGEYQFETACSDTANTDLHGQRGVVQVHPYSGSNPLLTHGALRVSKDRRHLEHADGTPFFWLGDTWWMAFAERLGWPEDFQLLVADRVAKGFTVIQIVAGLYPDMPRFDERGRNEAGLAWERDYERINPAYFDMADLRLQWLVRSGLMPCVLACWGYYLPWLGVAKMKQHWRYVIARWGAYPVVWCLAGEGAMPYYLSQTREKDTRDQIAGWTELGRYVRQTDPYKRLITIHPTEVGRDQIDDDSVLDFEMLQTGHGGYSSMPNTFGKLTRAYDRQPTMPTFVAEFNYEGMAHGAGDEIQRLGFWGSMLSGAFGHTYGANGLWQVNTRSRPYGPSPHGNTWGDLPWEDAHRLPGSQHVGLGARLLQRYPWWCFEPHQEWVEPAAGQDDRFAPYAGGIAGQVRLVYSFWSSRYPIKVKNIESDVSYRSFFFDPRTGQQHTIGAVKPESDGTWKVPHYPTMADWVLVLERV